MKTKFILHGGFAKGAEQANDAFFREMLKGAPDEVKILLVYFAEDPTRIKERRESDLEQFNKNKGGKVLSFETATEKGFPEQARRADVIYLHGGHSGRLLEALKRYPNIKELFEGKTVGGDSAGANVVTCAFYSDKAGPLEGLRLVPIKIISHYKEENKDKINHLRPDLETLHLSEYQFKVFEI
jgi:hypothetical protein